MSNPHFHLGLSPLLFDFPVFGSYMGSYVKPNFSLTYLRTSFSLPGSKLFSSANATIDSQVSEKNGFISKYSRTLCGLSRGLHPRTSSNHCKNIQYFGHLMRRTDSLEKILMLGKIEGRKRRGQQRMRWLDGIIDSMDMSLTQTRAVRNTAEIFRNCN